MGMYDTITMHRAAFAQLPANLRPPEDLVWQCHMEADGNGFHVDELGCLTRTQELYFSPIPPEPWPPGGSWAGRYGHSCSTPEFHLEDLCGQDGGGRFWSARIRFRRGRAIQISVNPPGVDDWYGPYRLLEDGTSIVDPDPRVCTSGSVPVLEYSDEIGFRRELQFPGDDVDDVIDWACWWFGALPEDVDEVDRRTPAELAAAEADLPRALCAPVLRCMWPKLIKKEIT